MTKKILALAMLLCTTAVFASEVKKADKDGDGTLDKNEVKAFKMLSNISILLTLTKTALSIRQKSMHIKF